MRTRSLAATLAALVAAVVLAGGGTPAEATTGSFEVPAAPDGTIPDIAGPQPAADAVAYAAGSAEAGWSVRLGLPGAGTRELWAIAPAKGLLVAVSASATRIAVSEHADHCTDCRYMSYVVTRDALSQAPLGGAPVDLVRCELGSCAGLGCTTGRQRFETRLDGDVLAFRDACTGVAHVADLASGAAQPLGRADAVAVGGRYVAVAQPGATPSSPPPIVVRDVDSGAEVYRPTLPAAPGVATLFGGSGPQLAVRADGVLVYVSPAPGGLALVVAAPGLPDGRVLQTVAKTATILGIGAAGVLLRTDGASRLQLVAFDGTAAAPLEIPDLVGTPSFDGHTLTWARRTCATATITSWRLGDAPPAIADLRCPTPRPVRRNLTLPRDRRLPVAFDCPDTARGGCLATARLTAQRPRARRPGRQRCQPPVPAGQRGAGAQPRRTPPRAAARPDRRRALGAPSRPAAPAHRPHV